MIIFKVFLRTFPIVEINEIVQDLQRNNYFVNIGNTTVFSEIPNITKTQKIISTNQLYQKFCSTDARGLVTIQAIVSLNIYYGGRLETSKETFTKFLHMSHQTLNKDNDLIFIQFDGTADLITELIFMLLDGNTRSGNVTNVIDDNIKNELSNYQFTFDVLTEIKIQDKMDNRHITKLSQTSNTSSSL